MARRTSTPTVVPDSPRSFNEDSTLTVTPATVATAITETNSPSPPSASSETSSSPRRRSITRLFSSHSSPMGTGRSVIMDPHPPPPLPLRVEREDTRVFDMGPRMSNNYKNLGFKVGGDLSATAGVPLSATISFESSGGTGALLIANDPIHRHLLRHRGILKAYFLAHREYIHDTYGQSEDLELDEMAFIYGQDCTSDWACAVTIEAERGSKVEFEVFSFLQTGVWGEWKTACSASQRGPHRDRSDEDPSRIPDQSIVIKRLTIQTRRFRSMKLHAFAEPKNGRYDQDRRESVGNHLTSSDWHDPLKIVHEYLLNNSKAKYSLASDDDALMLLKLVGRWESYSELKTKVWQEAQKHTTIEIDDNGVASLRLNKTNSLQSPGTTRTSMKRKTQHTLDVMKNTTSLTAF